MNSKIIKALDSNSDERTVYENGKIYKKVLEMIVLITNIIYFLKLYSTGVYGDILLNLIMFVINFCTFIGILKTVNLGTFEGSIHKITFYWSTFYTVNIMNIIWGLAGIIFKTNAILIDYIFIIGFAVLIVVEIIQTIYITKKIKKSF